MTDTWTPPEPDTIWRFTVDGAEYNLGRKLRPGERERIAKAFDASSIPDAVDAILEQFRDDTCEDRDYVCCDAFPPPEQPTNAEYAEWYDAHVAMYQQTHHGRTG